METSSKSTSIWQGTTPQLAFVFGIIAGAASILLIGWVVGFPTTKTKTASSGTTKTANPSPAPTAAGSEAVAYGDVAAVTDSDHIRGDQNAKLTLIEYSDFECPYCKQYHSVMRDQIMSEYDGQVRWILRHFPLNFHANAQKEAEAAECVGKLAGSEAYWDFSDKIFERTTSNGTGFALDQLAPLAKEVGANESAFTKCLDSGEMASKVTSDTSDGTGAGASGTPTTFIVGPDGKTIDAVPGAEPYAQVKSRIDQALATL